MIIAGLKVVRENASNWICFCPFHADTKTPNLYITKEGKYAGSYKCFACGKYGHISELDKTIKRVKMPEQGMDNIVIDWDKLNNKYVNQFCDNTMNPPNFTTYDMVMIYGCGWDGECYTFPLRDDMNKIIGIQRRFLDGKKRLITGSRAGLFLPQGINCLRNQWVYVCEGLSDTVTAMELGFFAIGRMSATTGTMLLCRLLRGKNVVVVGDNDGPGIDAANKLATKLIRHNCCITTVIVPGHKDLREFYKKEPEKVKIWLTEAQKSVII